MIYAIVAVDVVVVALVMLMLFDPFLPDVVADSEEVGVENKDKTVLDVPGFRQGAARSSCVAQ